MRLLTAVSLVRVQLGEPSKKPLLSTKAREVFSLLNTLGCGIINLILMNKEALMSLGLRRGTVFVEPHNTEWEVNAAETISKLHSILQDVLVDAQHIGSTAIKEIFAKPIIDIVAGVSDFDELLSKNSILEENGFIFRGQDHPRQYLYVCGENDIRTHHIHAVLYDSEEWNNYVDMRDYLNCHKEDAEAYSKLKESLAKQYSDDRETYTALKSDLIGEILSKARCWRKDQRA